MRNIVLAIRPFSTGHASHIDDDDGVFMFVYSNFMYTLGNSIGCKIGRGDGMGNRNTHLQIRSPTL